jgi:NAD(P)-dependent dehydrogenase (short-subunit alcohol dehydrogenase family)
MGVKRKIVLAAGGTAGIGEAIARAYANAGANVIITGRGQSRGERIAEELRGQMVGARFVRADLTSVEAVHRLVTEVCDWTCW